MPSQYRAIWSAPGGGTGYSVFHADVAGDSTDAQEFANAIREFFLDVQGLMPDDVSISFDSEVLNLSETGELVGVLPVTAPAAVVGSGTSGFSRATGARIDWSTGVIVSGRRLTGRTYIVPLESFCFDSSGLLTSIVQTNLLDAANGLLTALTTAGIVLKVWSRTHGQSAVVISASAPPKGAILRSRRD